MSALTRLRFLDKGVAMTVHTLTDDFQAQADAECTVNFFESSADETEFFVECDNPSELFTPEGKPRYLRLEFERLGIFHGVTAKSKALIEVLHSPMVCLTQISPIEALSRRQSPRHELQATVEVYKLVDPENHGSYAIDGKPLLYSGPVYDLSSDGMCFLTDAQPDLEKNGHYLLNIFLATDMHGSKGENFLFPAKLTRMGNAPQSALYRFDYGFLFELQQRTEERSRLITAIFRHKSAIAERLH